MKKFRLVIGIGIGLVILAAYFLIRSKNAQQAEGTLSEPEGMRGSAPIRVASPQPGHPVSSWDQERVLQEKRQQVIKGVVDMLSTPITFYGKVVDQFGDPVPHAQVGYGLLDNFNASGSTGKTSADENGLIFISGVRGAVITVGVEKAGFYYIDGVSGQSFAYGYGTDEYRKPSPSREDPAIFVLHKMGNTEPLIIVGNRSFRIPKDGTPVRVDLTTGWVTGAGQLKVEAWTSERAPGGPRSYDWRCRISIPGGGLVARKDQFEFEAPVNGYGEVDEVFHDKNEIKWVHRFNKEYFAKLADGTYARFKFLFTTGGTHYFEVESYINPKPGSRNLEYDPAKRIKP